MSCGKECENCGQVGGDGYAMSMTENIAGQPVVEAYNCCDNADVPAVNVADATNQVGGGVNPFNFIINPTTGARLSLFSSGGKALLKNMINIYKTGGAEEGTGQTAVDEGGDEKRKLTDAVEDVKSNTDESLGQLADAAIAAISEGINKESLAASKKFLEASKATNSDTDDEKDKIEAQEKLEKLIEKLEGGLAESAQKAAPEGDASAATKEAPAATDVGAEAPAIAEGGAPAEMADAFGEDYFNTEADALRGSWD